MHPSLKKIILIAPPLVIAGVYFNYIPLGPSVRQKLDSFIGKNKEVAENVPVPLVEKINGDVFMKDSPQAEPLMVKAGTVLKSGLSFSTLENSSVLLSDSGSFSWKLLVSAETQVNIDELMKASESKTSVFYLVKGGVILSTESNGDPRKSFTLRTRFASFEVKSATFSVLAGENRSLMTVHKGAVEADNYKLKEKTVVREGNTYIVNREGVKKVELDLEARDLYNWNVQEIENKLPTIEEVTAKVGDIQDAPSGEAKKKLDNLKAIDELITDFRTENEGLNRELEILKDNASKSREGFLAEAKNVNKDIQCLETSTSECNLFNAKVLYERGFPRLWGNPRYRNSLVVGLEKYLQERNEEVTNREEEAATLAKLMTAREAILKIAEKDRAGETNLERIAPLLQDARLRR